MTLEAKKNRAYIVVGWGSAAFGWWQHSFMAGCFMLAVLLFFGGLVVAIQDGFNGSDPDEEE
jgi:hypothetical protein